jgi:hypothetical protein
MVSLITGYEMVVVGGVMVIVLATGPKVRGFKPGRKRCFFKGEKIRSTSFGGEVKPSVSCRKILRHAEEHCGV